MTYNNLEPRVVEITNPSGEKLYMNPSTFNRIVRENGVFINPMTTLPVPYQYVNVQYVGRASKRKALTQRNMTAARRVSNRMRRNLNERRRSGKHFIPNNRNGYVSENWNTRASGGNQFTRYLTAGSPGGSPNRTPGRARTPGSARARTPGSSARRSLRMTPVPKRRVRRLHSGPRNENNNFGSPNRN